MTFVLQYTGSDTGVNANPGAFLGALAVFLGVAFKRGDFDFALLWKVGIPTVLVALVPVGLFAPGLEWLAGVAAAMGASFFLVLMMVMLGNMSYRYGMCALWLFAIERAVRLVFGQVGSVAGAILASQPLPVGELGVLFAAASVALALTTALIFASTLGKSICAIPHGSGNTDAIRAFCVDFAQKHGLEHSYDEHNNVLIRKNASKGYESHPAVVLQGHLDMVCEKTDASKIDFSNACASQIARQ